ncbi:hypothetical protein HMF8227_01959 [Saliniradius amylolyticus]|uniref:FlgO domain-containing protein n=1 Tax=Saliniradius amylolyticus TaxID=2183582 RepID=A0A2S2E4A8_9ALTE|nr:FlgO family outer membrane protein [Saliniradius amylolyticus]AWL12429.1 hypothetical protein HMF8227_01959 [Saliniradius amylolyticus]
MRAMLLMPLLLSLMACNTTRPFFYAVVEPEPVAAPQPEYRAPSNSYRAHYTHKALDDYANQIAMELMRNLGSLSKGETLAVASFVELDNSLNTTSVLGNQVAEKLIAQMQSYGITLVDYKATGDITVTAQGDLVFSRQLEDLASKQHIDYVLAGTLSRHHRGVDVSSRIISMQDRSVVSSASNFIPGFVVASLRPKLAH